jgi:hypothetical protein
MDNFIICWYIAIIFIGLQKPDKNKYKLLECLNKFIRTIKFPCYLYNKDNPDCWRQTNSAVYSRTSTQNAELTKLKKPHSFICVHGDFTDEKITLKMEKILLLKISGSKILIYKHDLRESEYTALIETEPRE